MRYTPAPMAPLRVAYLLEDTDLSGGVRVQLAQADGLMARGHSVTIFTKGLPLSWTTTRAEWVYVDDFMAVDASPFDFVIGGFWTTVGPAHAIAGERAIHLCQGYEGSFSFYAARKEAIDATYALPIPKLVVSPSLVPICRRFGSEVADIGQIVDSSFFRPSVPPEHQPLRVLLPGASQVDLKGVDDGYGAVTHARWLGAELDLIRLSPWRPSEAEPLDSVEEFHVALPAPEMTRLVHSCDILLAPNHEQEGFGLPAAEAMASGLAVVMTRIPSFLSFDSKLDYAAFGDAHDPVSLGEALESVLNSDGRRRFLRRRGREVAEQFRGEISVGRLERYLLERHAMLRAGHH
jgi:glycosyltransferase involved in cell wall biosynthesis